MLILLFEPRLSYVDVSYILFVFSSHFFDPSDLVYRHSRRPMVAVTLVMSVTSAALSDAMMQRWVEGSWVNANYVYFQGVLLWASLGLLCLEFARASVLSL